MFLASYCPPVDTRMTSHPHQKQQRKPSQQSRKAVQPSQTRHREEGNGEDSQTWEGCDFPSFAVVRALRVAVAPNSFKMNQGQVSGGNHWKGAKGQGVPNAGVCDAGM